MKFHILGVPHTQTTPEFSTCAFTQKVAKLCAMMHRRGHEVIHYGVEGATVECTEHVQVASEAERSKLYGRPGLNQYNVSEEEPFKGYLTKWGNRAKAEIAKRSGARATEIICVTWNGFPQRIAYEGTNQFVVESGIGYQHAIAEFRVYESYAWLHMDLGAAGQWAGGKWYWAVIPNAFDVAQFPMGDGEGDHFVYLGRLNDDKGIGLASQVCATIGAKLKICGQGDPARFLAPHVEYVKPVGPAARAKLLGDAKGVFCLSTYVEPFCGANVEAQMCGTPVITTDWGVFPETVVHGVTGYRCRTFEQMVWAARNVGDLDRGDIRELAIHNFSMERVASMYEEYFQSVLNIRWKKGFYVEVPARGNLDWLNRYSVSTYTYPDPDGSPPPPAPPEEPVLTEWQEAQEFERNWWGISRNQKWEDEERKQETYARLMGLIDMPDYSYGHILDIGCGPVSMLFKFQHDNSRAVDPLLVSADTINNYACAGVEFLNIKAEDMPIENRMFDEVWIYNCLQHVEDVDAIMKKALASGKAFRIFEWIDLGKCEGHPQNLTEDMFWSYFGGDDFERKIWNTGTLRDFGGTVTNKYIAIYAVRKASVALKGSVSGSGVLSPGPVGPEDAFESLRKELCSYMDVSDSSLEMLVTCAPSHACPVDLVDLRFVTQHSEDYWTFNERGKYAGSLIRSALNGDLSDRAKAFQELRNLLTPLESQDTGGLQPGVSGPVGPAPELPPVAKVPTRDELRQGMGLSEETFNVLVSTERHICRVAHAELRGVGLAKKEIALLSGEGLEARKHLRALLGLDK